jgi:hypothetical protein
MAIFAKIDPNPPSPHHYDEPGPDSPREPGDQPDQKLRSRDAGKPRRNRAEAKRPAVRGRRRRSGRSR